MAPTYTARAVVLALTVGGLSLLATTGIAHAQSSVIEFEEAELFFELNNTDGDLGIHSLIDGAGWRWLVIEEPATGATLLDISTKGSLRVQALTQLGFESTEPPFDQLDPAVFFGRFPEGTYAITGSTLAGRPLRSETELSHAMPAPPQNIRVNGSPLPVDCDEGPVPSVSTEENILIAWDPVRRTHPELGSPRGSSDIEIDGYEVFVDQDTFGLGVDREPSDTELLLPAGLLVPGQALVEVIAREATHNQTATESCFNVQ